MVVLGVLDSLEELTQEPFI